MKHTTSMLPPTIAAWMARICAAIIVLMPFHAFLSILTASLLDSSGLFSVAGLGGLAETYTAVRLWKECLLLLLAAGLIYLVITSSKLRQAFRRDRLFLTIGVYLAVLLLAGLVGWAAGTVNTKALAYGLLLDGRFLIFFIITFAVTQYSDVLVRLWKQLLLIPAAIAVGFATLQYTLLPADFLRHFGYGPDTIAPSATIDQKAAYQRVQSTMRGANPFGAYLVIILSAIGSLLLVTGRKAGRLIQKESWKWAVFFAAAGMALVFTFSRSAWLGILASLAWLIWTAISSRNVRRNLILTAAVAAVVFGAVGYGLRNNDHFQNVFFHTNEHSPSSESSNYGHLNALKDGAGDILFEPWGRGTGTAGPASVYNDGPGNGGVRIAENYFIQIGQEAGLIGMGLFIAINVLMIRRLWQGRGAGQAGSLSAVLLASFLGLIVVNLVSHAWTDDTLAYIWWGLAGAAAGYAANAKSMGNLSRPAAVKLPPVSKKP